MHPDLTEAQSIIGVDEAGRGPLAGPVVAAAITLPKDFSDSRIKDSKVISAKIRDKLFAELTSKGYPYRIVAVGPRRIDAINIRRATHLAMSLAVRGLPGDIVLVDGNMQINSKIKQQTVISGDRLFVQISAASILAKVYRDSLMKELDLKYPGYNFSKHSGYGTKEHRDAIANLGPCKIHRRTFAGVKEFTIAYA
jgi:ribonuclease HII